MDIAVRMEGGLGDHLLANRFVFAIRDKYPDAKIFAFSDVESNFKSDFLPTLFPGVYEKFEVASIRAREEFVIESQFGIENWPASMANVNDEYKRKFASADKFYNLHIDSLDFTTHDYEWLRYFHHFPRPTISLETFPTPEKFVACQLYARPNASSNLDKWYVEALVKKLSNSIPVVIMTLREHLDFYSFLSEIPNVTIECPTLLEATSIAKQCSAFIGIDSGLRYLPYHFSKPTFVFSKYCRQRGVVAPSQLIRWLLFENNVFPEYHDAGEVASIVSLAASDPTYALFPQSSPIDNLIVRRRSVCS